jgi:CRP-like cAMP-binding protein
VALTAAEVWELRRHRFEAALNGGEIWATRFLQAAARELARRMLAVDQELVTLMEESSHREAPVARVRELERLRRKLSGEWTF